MKKILLVANGRAGRGLGPLARAEAQKYLWGWDIQFELPTSLENFRELLWNTDAAKTECLILLGGDGTINQALPALMGRNIPLLCLPMGTANDLAEELGTGISWPKVRTLIEHGKTHKMDLISVNGHPFATVGGTGVGAVLTLQFNQLRVKSKIVGWLSKNMKSQMYTALSIENILLNRDFLSKVKISSDAYQGTHATSAIFVCNQQKLGGDLWVAPSARNSDGQFEVLIIPHTRTKDILKALAEIKLGRPPMGSIEFSTRKLVLESVNNELIPVFGDGENLTSASRLDFSVLPGSLAVYRSDGGK